MFLWQTYYTSESPCTIFFMKKVVKWCPQMIKDVEFKETEYAAKIKWIAGYGEEIYIPEYNDMLRVAFMYRFDRAKISDLVSLLSGRDFETREFKEEIV